MYSRNFLGAQWGRSNARGWREHLSGSKSIFFIEKRPLRKYFLLSIRKNALYPRFLGDRGLILRSELFLETIQLLPDPLMLIVSVSIKSYPLGSILLLSCLQLREHLAVGTDLLTLELLGVSYIREQLAHVVKLPAERVDIITKIRAVIIMGLIFDGFDDLPNLADPLVEVFQLTIDLALDDLQIRDHDADAHH